MSGYRDHYVRVFSPNGKKLVSFGSYGQLQGQFQYPMGTAVDKEGNILVADRGNHRIQKFTAQGKFLALAGAQGSKCLMFDRPDGIAFNDSNSKLYVADTFNHRIQVLNSDLTFSTALEAMVMARATFHILEV